MLNISELNISKEAVLNWAASFDVCCCLESNQLPDSYGKYDNLYGVGIEKELVFYPEKNFFDELRDFHQNQWLFGYFGYDLKNQLEDLTSRHKDNLHFPDGYFFVPKFVLAFKGEELEIISNSSEISSEEVIKLIQNYKTKQSEHTESKPHIKPKITREEYLELAKKVQKHIALGDIYEMNLCQEFYAEDAVINPLETWKKLNYVSPMPFATFLKVSNLFALSASPERFLVKRGNKLYSQPIKGTIRSSENPIENEKLKQHLKQDEKERAENVMIVDLVRNDLTRCAEPAGVRVEELCEVYTFKHVQQMISTISAEIKKDLHFSEAIKCCFPMGSMTGAPKIRSMQIIDDLEQSRRGLYSGAIGYITPKGDFDFNVVIRSILYNSDTEYLSFHVGSAITFIADPEKEYDECLLKAKAMMQVLS